MTRVFANETIDWYCRNMAAHATGQALQEMRESRRKQEMSPKYEPPQKNIQRLVTLTTGTKLVRIHDSNFAPTAFLPAAVSFRKGLIYLGLFRDASSWRSRNAQPSPVGYQTNDGTVALAVCGRTVDCRRSGRAHYTHSSRTAG